MGAYLGDYDDEQDARTAGARYLQTGSEIGVVDLGVDIRQFAGHAVLESDIVYVDDDSHLRQTPTPVHLQDA